MGFDFSNWLGFFFVLKEEFTTDKRKYLIWYLKIYEEQRGLFKVLLALNP